jgi:hypothetical protein
VATTKRPPTFDHLRKKQPLERTVAIPLNDEAVRTFKEASEALGRVQMVKGDDTEAQAAFDAAKAALEEETVELRFRSIGRKRYDDLVRAHPPTDEQKAEAADVPYEVESFSVALIAASCVEPKMTEDEVAELSETWNVAEFMQLWMAALEVNTQRRVVEMGKAWNGTHG